MNLPNKITTGRLVFAIILFAYLVFTDTCSGSDPIAPVIAGVGFVIAVATDALDGYYARKLGMTTDFGRIADPVADKVIVTGAFIFLVSAPWSRVFVPAWLAVLVVSREFLVTGLRGYIEARGQAFGARWDGKFKMIAQCVAVPSIFIVRYLDLSWGHEYPMVMDGAIWLAHGSMWISAILAVTSGFRYVMAAAAILRGQDEAQVP